MPKYILEDDTWVLIAGGDQEYSSIQNTGTSPLQIYHCPAATTPTATAAPSLNPGKMLQFSLAADGGLWVKRAGVTDAHNTEITYATEGADLPPVIPPPPLPTAGWSLRRINPAYSGPALTIRRSSDNQEMSTGYTNQGDLDLGASLVHADNAPLTPTTGEFVGEGITEFNQITSISAFMAGANINAPDTVYTFTKNGVDVDFSTIPVGDGQVDGWFIKYEHPYVKAVHVRLTKTGNTFTLEGLEAKFATTTDLYFNFDAGGTSVTLSTSPTNPSYGVTTITLKNGLLGFVKGDSAYITTLYDQVGIRHLVQPTDYRQPRLFNAGVVETLPNGQPTIQFDGGSDALIIEQSFLFNFPTGNTVCMVLDGLTPLSDNNTIFNEGNNADWAQLYSVTSPFASVKTLGIYIRGDNINTVMLAVNEAHPTQVFDTALPPAQLTSIDTTNTFKIRINSIDGNTYSYTRTPATFNTFCFGGVYRNASYSNHAPMRASELLVYDTPLANDTLLAAEASQTGYFIS